MQQYDVFAVLTMVISHDLRSEVIEANKNKGARYYGNDIFVPT